MTDPIKDALSNLFGGDRDRNSPPDPNSSSDQGLDATRNSVPGMGEPNPLEGVNIAGNSVPGVGSENPFEAVQTPGNSLPGTGDAAMAGSSYTVNSGDSLWAIAEKFYGDGSQWPRIFEANRNQITNPDLIYPGQQFQIPQ